MITDNVQRGLIITVEFHENVVETDIFDDTYNYLSTMLKDLTLYPNMRGRDNGSSYISSDEDTKTVPFTLTIMYPDDDVQCGKRVMADMNSFNNFSTLNDLPMYCQHYSVVKWGTQNPKKA